MTVIINSSLKQKLGRLLDFAEDQVEDELRSIADDAINITLTSTSSKGKVGAVDTGAYIGSFSITSGGSGRPRGKSSRGKTRNRSDAFALGDKAKADLNSDINKVDLKSTTSLVIRNHSPHARYVEYGRGANYRIFAQLRSKHG